MIGQYSFGNNTTVLSKKSFIAYIKPMSIWFVIWIVASAISVILSIIGLIIGIGIVFYIRSYALFVDDVGVWVFRGIFPWDSGIYGVRWRDFGEAEFYLNPVSWSLKSYRIHIKNRYKNEPEFILKDMHNGDVAVSQINAMSM